MTLTLAHAATALAVNASQRLNRKIRDLTDAIVAEGGIPTHR